MNPITEIIPGKGFQVEVIRTDRSKTATVKVVESVVSGQEKKALEWALVALYAQLVMATGPLFMVEVSAAVKKVLEDFPST